MLTEQGEYQQVSFTHLLRINIVEPLQHGSPLLRHCADNSYFLWQYTHLQPASTSHLRNLLFRNQQAIVAYRFHGAIPHRLHTRAFLFWCLGLFEDE
jgi:hypothetical protein